jgi:hypothetical protein
VSKLAKVLTEAKTLIEDPSKWCQKAYARDAEGKATMATAPDACQWCSLGAAMWALNRSDLRSSVGVEHVWDLLDKAAQSYKYRSADIVNDSTDHPTVMAMFDRAIDIAKDYP